MTRKSRLSTAWQRIAVEIDSVILREFGSAAVIPDQGELRSLSRTLACWCIRLVHSSLSHRQRESLREWSRRTFLAPFDALAAILFRLEHPTGEFAAPLNEIASLAQTRVISEGDPPPSSLDVVNRVHELLLWLETPHARRQRGAYYTPQGIAKVVVEIAHERMAAITPDGRGLWSPTSRVLDFAAGTGAFFAAAQELRPQQKLNLSQWLGMEIDAETHAIGQFCSACQQLELAFPLDSASAQRFWHGDALTDPEISAARFPGTSEAFNVILGNPPYSALGGAETTWLDGLLRGRDPFGGRPLANYHAVAKQTAAHRKHSLSDDYVRFLRLAHWHLERAGRGVIGLILNHGILENSSFRQLRASLYDDFDEVLLLDLHGNAKRRELTPEGGRDESIFNIEQGAMIAVLSKLPNSSSKKAQIGHVYGLRDEKIKKIISRDWDLQDVLPASPQFYFHCQRRRESRLEQLYDAALPLNEIMPLHGAAIVTARDALVVDQNRERLKSRIDELADPRITDKSIREKYFAQSHHRSFAPGDTRSWRLERARKALALEGESAVTYVGFWYRPWDYRWLAYCKQLIDWRRERFTPLLLSGNNLSLVARRQSPPGADCKYFWTSNSIVLDGILRSDNRGTEFVFPLFSSLYMGDERSSIPAINLSQSATKSAATLGIDSEDYFYLLIALLHAQVYQTAFREQLCRGFPRILQPKDPDVAKSLIEIGRRISAIEQLQLHSDDVSTDQPPCMIGDELFIAPSYPKFRENSIWINAQSHFPGVPYDSWNLKAGAHQPILRWLKQRRLNVLAQSEIDHFRQMLNAAGALHRQKKRLNELLPFSSCFEDWLPVQ
jgi:hypothetical protein